MSRADRLAGDLGLGAADIAGAEQDLALEIVERHPIVVDHPQRADARRGEILDGGRADPARADDRDCRAEQLPLSLAANLLEDDMAGVAVELGVGEAHRPGRAEAAAAARRLVQILDLGEGARGTGAGTSWAIRSPRHDSNGSCAEIDEHHLHLAAIVGVDRAG